MSSSPAADLPDYRYTRYFAEIVEYLDEISRAHPVDQRQHNLDSLKRNRFEVWLRLLIRSADPFDKQSDPFTLYWRGTQHPTPILNNRIDAPVIGDREERPGAAANRNRPAPAGTSRRH